jgi:hypothetical protein
MAVAGLGTAVAATAAPRWSQQQAWDWYNRQPWLVGCNFLPSTAINDTEMWQEETFDAETIDRELGWAQKLGYNSCRVFLQYIVWRADPDGFKRRFERLLSIAGKHGMTVMPIFFDDCAFAGKEPYPGRQDDPVPGVHNSGWVPSPGAKLVADRDAWPDLEKYVREMVKQFGQDKRIVIWDLYNEPSRTESLPLVEAAFRWAREASPSQPLTTCIFGPGELPRRIEELSDVISFHNYNDLTSLRNEITARRQLGRPLVCTEWMCRGQNSRFESHLPVFRREKVGCYNWGLVAGRTQTYYPWGSPKGAPEPKLWHHDVLRKDGSPFDPGELLIIGQYTDVVSVRDVVPVAERPTIEWSYCLEKPDDSWPRPDFDDSRWPRGLAPFGAREPRFSRDPATEWKTPDIWLRRNVELPEARPEELCVRIYHDDDAEVYINGVLTARAEGFSVGYRLVRVLPEAAASVRRGRNVLAVHCRQTTGGQYIDVGIVEASAR